jgi:hypothetical protein
MSPPVVTQIACVAGNANAVRKGEKKKKPGGDTTYEYNIFN